MNIQDNIKNYYGKVLQNSGDLQTDACCTIDDTPDYLKPLLRNIHPEITKRYYGCGLIAPLALEGAHILDLGSGSGHDAYVLAQLAGTAGSVTGVDMTPEQLATANQYQDWHSARFGFSNVEFIEGDLENLDALDLPRNHYDVIVSNCVLNLLENKDRVFHAAYALLKPGGEFYFSDVYADRRLPTDIKQDPIAQGECLGGALYWNDFLTMAKRAGFKDARLVTDRPLRINNRDLRRRLIPAQFHAATYRLFKVEGLENACEDYGQAVIYQGGVDQADAEFALDNHHHIHKGRVFPVCGNTFRILQQSRFAPHFKFIGDDAVHYGIFPGCGVASPFGDASNGADTSGSCC